MCSSVKLTTVANLIDGFLNNHKNWSPTSSAVLVTVLKLAPHYFLQKFMASIKLRHSKQNLAFQFNQSVDTKSLSSLGLYKDQLRTQILKNKYQLGTKSDSKKEN